MSSVLITGCSKGIGLETALAFARAGHQVHATMRNPSQSPALAETAAREKLPITISTMDVDSDESVSNAIAAIQKNGPIDVLINNAGVEGVGPVEEFPLASFRAIMETNYFGALRCIQAVVPEMRATPEWLHHQCKFRGRAHLQPTAHLLLRLQVGTGSA